jgi:hypothetical protein
MLSLLILIPVFLSHIQINLSLNVMVELLAVLYIGKPWLQISVHRLAIYTEFICCYMWLFQVNFTTACNEYMTVSFSISFIRW